MLGMHSARCQDRDRVDLLAREKVVDVVVAGNAELRGDGLGTRAGHTFSGKFSDCSFENRGPAFFWLAAAAKADCACGTHI